MKKKICKIVQKFKSPPKTVSIIRLSGPIGEGGRFSKGLSEAALSSQIEKAFEQKRLAAVALAINSPGGSPAQSAMIASRIKDLAKENDVPVFAFCEDVAASGGYWLACAADEIYADQTSIIGSIGVISAHFGFVDAIEKLGIQRRVYHAGKNKMRLDPFSPEKPGDIKHLRALQDQIHDRFVSYVTESREGRLSSSHSDIFSGDFWVGEDALDRGLIDGFGHLRSVMREKFGDKINFKEQGQKKSILQRFGLAQANLSKQNLATGLCDDIIDTLEARAHWSRFGL